MKTIMVMFDTLNRRFLPPYRSNDYDPLVHAPNFERLARRTATFDRSYVCSMPCMPARRDFHTGRPNFLHCPWGPIEPFDDSVPQMLASSGVQTHLCSDHYHYWEDGGATYHTRYSTWEFFRGQEGDSWIGQVADPPVPPHIQGGNRRQDWVNRQFMRRDEDLSQTRTFNAGLKYIDRNHDQDNWFLQIECFDPHEPFFSNRKYRDLYPPDPDDVALFDWPAYGEVKQTPEEIEACRRNYAALVSKCDASLGDVLDAMDRYDLWNDTMLIVWTDHGFLLGERHQWGKIHTPLYQEIANTPFFVWDPRHPEAAGQRRGALVQPAIDLGPTLLEYFGVDRTPDMRGKPLGQVIENDTPVREAAIFGYHGNRVNVTDGRYVYMRSPADEKNEPLFSYTVMPTNMRGFKLGLDAAQMAEPFSFTKGARVMKLPRNGGVGHAGYITPSPAGAPLNLLYDVENDPDQQHPLQDDAIEKRLIEQMTRLMKECDAPTEQYERMGLSG